MVGEDPRARGSSAHGSKSRPIGRVTVSLPDELEAELDRYAQQRAQPVSQVVAEALVRFLREAIPPPSPPGEALGATQEYVARLALQVEWLRVSLDEVALWVDTRPPRNRYEGVCACGAILHTA